jgi:hypothetical protein
LLAIDIAAVDVTSLLPADDSGYGFDNIGDVLTVSATLLDAYMSVARKVARLAIGDPATLPVLQTYTLPKYVMQDGWMSEDLPFGSRGGMAVRHHFPLDAEYSIRIRLQRSMASTTGNSIVLGFAEPHELDVRIDGRRVKTFTVGDERGGSKTQAQWDEADASLEVRVPVQAGTHLVGVAFLSQPFESEGVFQPPVTDYSLALNYGFADTEPAIGSITIGGPYEARGIGEQTPSQRGIFVCRPNDIDEELPCAKRIISRLARRAYRKPVP